MEKTAEITLEGKKYSVPVVVGTEGEKAVDITKLRAETSFISLDPGFCNTGSCISTITFINGEKGILRFRGIPIEQLAEQSTFVETAFLVIYGRLPKKDELNKFSQSFVNNLWSGRPDLNRGNTIFSYPVLVV